MSNTTATMIAIASFIVCAVGSEGSEGSGIEWASKEASIQSADTTVRYEFSNNFPYDIALIELVSCCGIKGIAPAKRIFAPGESGTVSFRVTLGDRRGDVNKTVGVKFASTQVEIEKQELAVVGHIPEEFHLERTAVFWVGAETAVNEKKYSIRPSEDYQTEILGIAPEESQYFEVHLLSEDGSEYVHGEHAFPAAIQVIPDAEKIQRSPISESSNKRVSEKVAIQYRVAGEDDIQERFVYLIVFDKNARKQ